MRIICVAAGFTRAQLERFQRGHVRFTSRPVDLMPLLDADLWARRDLHGGAENRSERPRRRAPRRFERTLDPQARDSVKNFAQYAEAFARGRSTSAVVETLSLGHSNARETHLASRPRLIVEASA